MVFILLGAEVANDEPVNRFRLVVFLASYSRLDQK